MGKEAIAPINKAEAEVALRRLAWLNQSLPELLEWFDRNPDVDKLWCFRLFSLEEGLKRLEAFLPEMRRAMQYHAKGKALGPTSSKARKPKAQKTTNKSITRASREAKTKPQGNNDSK